MAWEVRLSAKARRKLKQLPPDIDEIFQLLLAEMKVSGPTRGDWPNYGKLSNPSGCYHCHLQKGNPTYVAVWRVVVKGLIEVIYVGTHEKAPY
jgi:mRNA-degrading endonuclease RelE of RelBE toxin-antitoxin system